MPDIEKLSLNPGVSYNLEDEATRTSLEAVAASDEMKQTTFTVLTGDPKEAQLRQNDPRYGIVAPMTRIAVESDQSLIGFSDGFVVFLFPDV